MQTIDILTEIEQLRAELQDCALTRKERRDSERRIKHLRAEVRRRCELEEA